MLGSKKFEKTIVCFMIVAVLFSVIMRYIPNIFSLTVNNDVDEYSTKIFCRDVINIEITADENDWNEMLENKMSKPYISCDLKIDGREFKNVGLRPKGNSSLTSIQGDRISYRLDFDQYIDNQTCYGLEKMVLNNLQADATYMKDFIAYDLMNYEGVNAPLHTYAFITLNGVPFGLYLAVEVYDEDYLTRVYNDTNIKLYSVKSSGLDKFENAIVDPERGTVIKSNGIETAQGMGGPGGPPPNGGNGGPPQFDMQPPLKEPGNGDISNKPGDTLEDMGPSELKGDRADASMPPPPGGNDGGGDLKYIDNSTASYKNIFANSVSDDTDAKDYLKIIQAIKVLNKENVNCAELEKYWNVDEILRYLAVHTFMVNADSYTGNMKQNYYLAENNGQISVLPWDYNLSFGAFGGGPDKQAPSREDFSGNSVQNRMNEWIYNETTSAINHAIDTPVFDSKVEERPLVSVLLNHSEYKERYHQYLNDLTNYISGDFIAKLEKTENAIYPYIERETVSFYSPEEHKNAFETVKKFLMLRSESIKGQLNGEIPSETDKQINCKMVTADFSINDMGSMGGPGGNQPEPPNFSGTENEQKMMPPPNTNLKDNQQGMPPPPPGMMPGIIQEQNSGIEYLTLLLSILCLGVLFILVKMFKRNY